MLSRINNRVSRIVDIEVVVGEEAIIGVEVVIGDEVAEGVDGEEGGVRDLSGGLRG